MFMKSTDAFRGLRQRLLRLDADPQPSVSQLFLGNFQFSHVFGGNTIKSLGKRQQLAIAFRANLTNDLRDGQIDFAVDTQIPCQ